MADVNQSFVNAEIDEHVYEHVGLSDMVLTVMIKWTKMVCAFSENMLNSHAPAIIGLLPNELHIYLEQELTS